MYTRIKDEYRKDSLLSKITITYVVCFLIDAVIYSITRNNLVFWIGYVIMLLGVFYFWVVYVARKTNEYRNIFCIIENIKIMKFNIRNIHMAKLINILKREKIYKKENIKCLMEYFNTDKKGKLNYMEIAFNITIAIFGIPYIYQQINTPEKLIEILLITALCIWIIVKAFSAIKEIIIILIGKYDMSEELQSLLTELYFKFDEMGSIIEDSNLKDKVTDKTVIITPFESQLRQLLASIVWTHKIHEKQADIYAKKYGIIILMKNIFFALSISGIVSTIFVEEKILSIVSACLLFINIFIDEFLKINDYKELQRGHKKTAVELLREREKLIRLISDIKTQGVNSTELYNTRNEISDMYVKICSEAMDASEKAVVEAKTALKITQDNTFSDEEIDSYLPAELRKG